jgi:hypothetical protein
MLADAIVRGARWLSGHYDRVEILSIGDTMQKLVPSISFLVSDALLEYIVCKGQAE